MDGEVLRIGSSGVVPVVWDLVTKADSDPGSIEGYASVFDVVDDQDDIVSRGAFGPALARWRLSKSTLPLVLDHEASTDGVIGSVARAAEDPRGLRFGARFATAQRAQDARQKAREGHLRGVSFKGIIGKQSFAMRGGREVRVIEAIDRLIEVTLSAFPANMHATITLAKSGLPVHHTAVTDTGRWDAGANVGRIGNDTGADTLRLMYALVRPGADSGTKSAYALPHHVVDQDGRLGPAHIAGVRNALARLPNVQGIDDTARSAAERHLRAHLDDFNQRAAAGLDLPTGWADDMRSALAITDAIASKAAVDRLVTSHYGAVLAGGYRHVDPEEDPVVEEVGDGNDAARYALDLVGQTGKEAGGDSTSDSLADLMASVEAQTVSSQLDALAAELGKE